MLHTEMDKRKITYVSMAPTNKACRIIKGKTIHKFIASFNIKSFTVQKYEYIFIDEISMVQEIFYKFFVCFSEHFLLYNLEYQVKHGGFYVFDFEGAGI